MPIICNIHNGVWCNGYYVRLPKVVFLVRIPPEARIFIFLIFIFFSFSPKKSRSFSCFVARGKLEEMF